MNFEDALKIADEAVMRLEGRHLNNAERVVLGGSWDDLSYEKIAEQSARGFSARYLAQDVGKKLWDLLSKALGERVSKKTFRTAFEIRFSRNSSTGSEPLARSPLPSSQLDSASAYPSTPSQASENSHQNWNELLIDVSNFYGRGGELSELETWIVEKHCRLVVLCGMKGIGKTLLSQKLKTQVQARFTQTLCLSLRQSPSPTELLVKLLQSLTELQENIPLTLDGQLSYLIQYFHQSACLVILDDTEAVCQEKTLAGCYRAGYEDYGKVLQRVAETLHRSCLIWVGQEEPEDLAVLKGYGARSLTLPGLSTDEGRGLLQSRGDFLNPDIDWSNLVKRCDGNPLVLLIACDDIEVFSEEIEEHWTGVIEQIREQFDEQFDRLSPEEIQVMYWLAIAQEPLSLADLRANIVVSPSSAGRTIQSLMRRSLCAQIQGTTRFAQSQIVTEYVLQRFLQQILEGVQTGNLALLSSHTLFQAQAPEYIREKQLCYILKPLAESIRDAYASVESIDQQMKQLLAKIRSHISHRSGYAAGNLINLGQQLDLNLTDDYDFSDLTIRQADLWRVSLNNSNFVRADLSQSMFASPLGSSIALAFSPDGTLLATGDEDGRVLLWQVSSGQLGLICQNPDQSPIRSLAFNPGGDTLAGASEDQRIKLWNVRTGEQWSGLSGDRDPVQSVCFSPDGRILASASPQTIRLWNIYSRRRLRILDDSQEETIALCFSHNGELLVSCGNQTAYLWEVSSGTRLQTLPGNTNSVFKTVLFQSVDASGLDWANANLANANTAIAAEVDDRAITLWKVESGEFYGNFLLQRTQDRSETAVTIAFSADGQRMASGIMVTESGALETDHYRYIVKIWDVQTKTSIQTLEGFSSQVHALAFSADGQFLAASGDRQIRLWSVNSGQCLRAMQDCREPACSFTFSHDGTRLIVGNRDHTIRLWQLDSGHRYQTLLGQTTWVDVVAASPDGKLLASSSYDKVVRLWDIQTGEQLRAWGAHTERIRVMGFSPNGQCLASGSTDQTVKLWNVSTGACLGKLLGHEQQVSSLCFSADGMLLASGGADDVIQLWDLETQQPLRRLEGHEGRVHSLSFSADGQRLIGGSYDASVRIWDVATGICLNSWQGSTERVNAVVFDRANRAIASISDVIHTNVMIIWDVNSNELIQTLEWDQFSKIWQAYFSLDGKFLASGTDDGVIRVWHWSTGKCLRALRVASPYAGMNIRDAQGLSKPQKAILAELGAIER